MKSKEDGKLSFSQAWKEIYSLIRRDWRKIVGAIAITAIVYLAVFLILGIGFFLITFAIGYAIRSLSPYWLHANRAMGRMFGVNDPLQVFVPQPLPGYR